VHFDEREVGAYRIYAGAIEAPGGYVAAAVVKQVKGAVGMPEVYRNEAMAGGHRFATPDEALKYALAKAKEWIEPLMELAEC
jgi:hypothetical protein